MPHRRQPPGFLVAACAAVSMVSLTLGTVGPLLPRFSAAMDSTLYAALVVAGHPVGSLLVAVPTLVASRRFGLPRVIVAGSLLVLASSLLFVRPGAGWWIVLARVGYGAGGTIVWQSVFAWAITNSGPARRGRTIGTLLAASTAGLLAAPQLGALADRYGLWLCALPPLALAAAASRFAAVRAYEMRERPDLPRLRGALGSRDALAGIGLTSGGAIVALGVNVSLPLALHRHGVPAFGIGAVLTAAYAGAVLLNPVAGRLADRGRTRRVVVGGFALVSAALLGLALAPDAAIAVCLAVGCAALTGLPGFAGGVLMSRAVDHAGVDQTVSQTLGTLSWAPAAIVGSVVAGSVASPQAALLLLAAATALAAALAALERTARRPQVAWASRRGERG